MSAPNPTDTTPSSSLSSPSAAAAAKINDWDKVLGFTLIQNNRSGTGSASDKEGDAAKAKYTTLQTREALNGKEFVLLYFSASWCPPCRSFSPILKSFYKLAQLANERIEIVYISSDKSISEFDEYFGTMPWLSLPLAGTSAIKSALAQSMQISGIPALIVLTGEGGLFVTDQARQHVTSSMRKSSSSPSTAQDNAKEVVRQWRDIKAVPLSEADLGSNASGAKGIIGFLMGLLKSPVAIFALVYFVKWAMRQRPTLTQKADDQVGDTTDQLPYAEEAEF